MGRWQQRASAAALLLLTAGCASALESAVERQVDRRDGMAAARAYQKLAAQEGPDADLRAEVSAALLEQAAWSPNAAVRDAALSELVMAGGAGESVLDRLAEAAGTTVARARALEVLVQRGHRWARAYLYALLDDDDLEVVAAAVAAVDPSEEAGRLVDLLGHSSAAVRAAAARRLVESPPVPAVRRALATVARRDPEAAVRAAAVEALGAQGPAAVGDLRERLGDPAVVVRMAAVAGLLREGGRAGATAVGALLDTPPSAAGVEAARRIVVDLHPAREAWVGRLVDDATAYLVAALRAGSGPLRSQAAVAAVSLPDLHPLDAPLLEVLEAEPDPEVRFQLARAVLARSPREPRAVAALEAVMKGDGMPAVQAAALLASRDRKKAVERLDRALKAGTPVLRSAAARALACDAHEPEHARKALLDRDPLVRVHAAGALLRCL